MAFVTFARKGRVSTLFNTVRKIITTMSTNTTNGDSVSVEAPKRVRLSNGEEVTQKTIGTHSGTFHCDEVLACFMLRQLPEYENARIFRSRDDGKLREQCDIILDVGGEFDHEKKWYDHHQKSFQETFSSLRPDVGDDFKIRLSSAGLIYVYYGERVIERILQRERQLQLSPENLKLTFMQIYRNFMIEIDAIDNGVPMFEAESNVGKPLYKISTHLSARIGRMNPSWEDENTSDEAQLQRFERAMTAAGREFVENVLQVGASWIKAREHVREALEKANSWHESGEILVLERFCPWKAHLADLEKELGVEGVPKLVVFSENEKSWRVAGVPLAPDSFLGRKFLPSPWRGLRDEELCKVAGLPGLVFVHHSGFIGGALTREGALQMAIKSVTWEDEQ